MALGRTRVIWALNRAIEVLREEGPEHYAVLAIKLGYSPEYFRRAILPALINMTTCIVKEGSIIKYTCDDGESESVEG